MKIKKLIIENFRGYEEKTEISFENLTVLVGKNDIGKSTILEALDLFFNEGKNLIKIDKGDKNVFSECEDILIGAEFTAIPNKLIVDATVETNLKEEFLVNEHGNLEIFKRFKNGKLISTTLNALYPSEEQLQDLHTLNISKLKSLANELGIKVEDKRKSSLFRKAIIKSFQDLKFELKEIDISKEGAKQIWSSLSNYLPLYSLFQSDRKNEDKDSEIQEPMKAAISEVLKSQNLVDQLDYVFEEVTKATSQLAALTIEKLEEIDPEIARELTPTFKKPSWDKVFSCGLESDKSVPLNKRGSGVRRLVLLSFFRAEAERRKTERGVPNVIYAFEEPETSQHPINQKILIDSFIELSKYNVNQIIFTTHSPEIAKMMPEKSIRFIDKEDGKVRVFNPTESILEKIASSLGVLPTVELKNANKVKVAICVEGKNDIDFLTCINNKIPEFKAICDITSDEYIILPMGGSSLQYWVNNKYISKLNLAQVHIYDSDIGSDAPNKYRKYIHSINSTDNSYAFETSLREMENYITPILFEEIWGQKVESHIVNNWNEIDVPLLDAQFVHNDSESEKEWADLKEEKKKKKISKAKIRINTDYSSRITKEMLEERGIYTEIERWFNKIKELTA